MTRHRAIEDQAIDWLIRRDEPDWGAEDQAGLDAWLDQSMAHKAAYWRAEHGWRETDRIRSLGIEGQVEARPVARRWWPIAMAAGIVATLGLGTLTMAPDLFDRPAVREARYDTAVGARRTVPLADGSKVELNTATVVRAAVGQRERSIWLDEGEAYFEVAHKDGQPFVVHVVDRTVTVLGTKFSVRRDGDRVTVNVLEGRVRVDDGQGDGGRAAIITAGDIAISRGPSTLIAARSEEKVENALAWRDGMLSFDQTMLADVATEFNRYNRKPIVIGDADAAAIRIGGTFRASNVATFARLLHDAYGLKVEEDGERIKISS